MMSTKVKKQFDILFICLAFSAFLLITQGCGTDVYYALEPPTLVSSPNTDPANRFFCFNTNDFNNYSLSVYKGTAVYYKIYNNTSMLNSDITAISSANTEYSSNGMNRLLNYGYQALLSSSTSSEPLFSANSSNRKIRIRLFNEGSGNLYEKGIFINDSSTSSGSPLRYNRTDSFDFSSSNLPNLTDIDVKGNSDSGTSKWYVNAYAVSVGRDEYLANLYSQVTHLGYIEINVD